MVCSVTRNVRATKQTHSGATRLMVSVNASVDGPVLTVEQTSMNVRTQVRTSVPPTRTVTTQSGALSAIAVRDLL